MKYFRLLPPVILLLPSTVFPQLLSCPEIGCPMYGSTANCQLDDFKATAIGVSKINSSLSDDLLTWTVATGADPRGHPDDSDLSLYRKDFYLGTPSTLQLQNANSVEGCALFFEGVSGLLDFPLSRDDGTCADVLTEACVSDWMKQVDSIISQNATDMDCDDLGKTLQASPPGSCANRHGSWGEVTSHVIAGSASPNPIQLDQCVPTISRSYTVRRIESFNVSTLPVSNTLLSRSMEGVTPVMTIFTPREVAETSGNGGPTISAPELHLNCLRITEGGNRSSSPGEVSSGTNTSPTPSYSLLITGFVVLLVLPLFRL